MLWLRPNKAGKIIMKENHDQLAIWQSAIEIGEKSGGLVGMYLPFLCGLSSNLLIDPHQGFRLFKLTHHS